MFSTKTLKTILGVLLIVAVLILTVKFIKMLPAFVKVLALAANVLTIWWAMNNLIRANKKEKQNNNLNN